MTSPHPSQSEQQQKAYLWVVEMLLPRGWEPTVGVALTREAARKQIAEWRENCPSDKFRLRFYVRRTDDE